MDIDRRGLAACEHKPQIRRTISGCETSAMVVGCEQLEDPGQIMRWALCACDEDEIRIRTKSLHPRVFACFSLPAAMTETPRLSRSLLEDCKAFVHQSGAAIWTNTL
jgi:hypothetical protein